MSKSDLLIVQPGGMNLSEIVALAKQQLALQDLVTDLENALSTLKEELRRVQEEDLPMAMAEAGGLTSMKLDDGATVTIKQDMTVGIKAEDKPKAYKWLEDHQYGAVIATSVTAEFSKGDMEKAQKLLTKLANDKYTVTLSRAVHWQTLKALLLEQTKAGKKIPLDLFGARAFNKAVVKPPKSN
jgi:nitrogen regulatory protein PII-like uncharacterized protein